MLLICITTLKADLKYQIFLNAQVNINSHFLQQKHTENSRLLLQLLCMLIFTYAIHQTLHHKYLNQKYNGEVQYLQTDTLNTVLTDTHACIA
jgi:hypothetical protein